MGELSKTAESSQPEQPIPLRDLIGGSVETKHKNSKAKEEPKKTDKKSSDKSKTVKKPKQTSQKPKSSQVPTKPKPPVSSPSKPKPPATQPKPPSSGGSSEPQPVGGPSGNWKLAFSDEFSGSSLDSSKWESTWFGEGTTMNNVGTYSSNVEVKNGSVWLWLSSETRGALIHTGYKPGHYQFPVGSYIEARIYFPGNGTNVYNWPAFWVNSTRGYPASGEHDIAEGLEEMTVNYHSPSGAHNQGVVPGIWTNAYHTYGLYRGSNSAKAYYNGKLVKQYSTDDDGRALDIIFNIGVPNHNRPTHIGRQYAIGIDYVRTWSPK